MVLRRITIDNNVNYIAQSEQTKERDVKPKTTSNSRKQHQKNCHKTMKKSLGTYKR